MSTWKINRLVYERVSGQLEMQISCEDYERFDVNRLLGIIGKLGVVASWYPLTVPNSESSVNGRLSVYLYDKLKPNMQKAYQNFETDHLREDLAKWLNVKLNAYKKKEQ